MKLNCNLGPKCACVACTRRRRGLSKTLDGIYGPLTHSKTEDAATSNVPRLRVVVNPTEHTPANNGGGLDPEGEFNVAMIRPGSVISYQNRLDEDPYTAVAIVCEVGFRVPKRRYSLDSGAYMLFARVWGQDTAADGDWIEATQIVEVTL